MGTAKLMTPLFYDGNYNVEKKRMRAVLEREVSNGAVSYRLWRSDGKPDLEYPRAANNAYILHVEVNDHLVPLQMTDYALVNHCGLLPATIALYGSEEGREEYFKHLRDSGAAGTGAFTEAMARETEKIIELGNDSARQADYIKSVLDKHVAAFFDSKECDGKSFRRYQVDVPLRTQGWINDKLISVTIENGKCEHLRYMRSKGAQCSQKIFDCMHELILKVCSETEE